MQIKSRKPMRFEVIDEGILLNCFYFSYLVLKVDMLIDEFLHSEQLLMDRSDFECALVLKYQLLLWLINDGLILVRKLTFLLLKLLIISLLFRRSRINLINLHLSMLTWFFRIAHVQNIKYLSFIDRVSIDCIPRWSSTGSNCIFPSFRLWFVRYFLLMFLFLYGNFTRENVSIFSWRDYLIFPFFSHLLLFNHFSRIDLFLNRKLALLLLNCIYTNTHVVIIAILDHLQEGVTFIALIVTTLTGLSLFDWLFLMLIVQCIAYIMIYYSKFHFFENTL